MPAVSTRARLRMRGVLKEARWSAAGMVDEETSLFPLVRMLGIGLRCGAVKRVGAVAAVGMYDEETSCFLCALSVERHSGLCCEWLQRNELLPLARMLGVGLRCGALK